MDAPVTCWDDAQRQTALTQTCLRGLSWPNATSVSTGAHRYMSPLLKTGCLDRPTLDQFSAAALFHLLHCILCRSDLTLKTCHISHLHEDAPDAGSPAQPPSALQTSWARCQRCRWGSSTCCCRRARSPTRRSLPWAAPLPGRLPVGPPHSCGPLPPPAVACPVKDGQAGCIRGLAVLQIRQRSV